MPGELFQFLGSLTAIAALVAIAWWLGLGGTARISNADEARELADNAVCGFEPAEIALDADGHGALLRDPAGHIMLLAPHGIHFAARMLGQEATARLNGERLTVSTGERRLRPITLDLGAQALAWCRRIEGIG
ncbi:MAG TPA: hypothetical protein VGA34_10120 [Alteraurantiacibacter sp.]|jgi:hypothetical protein